VSAEQRARSESIRVLRGTTYFIALLIFSSGALLAYVSSVLAYAAFGLIIGAVLVLLVYLPIGRMSVSSATLVALAFIVPETFVHQTFTTARCVQGVPCDAVPNSHPGLRLGLAAAVLVAALVTAAVGVFRSSRPTDTPHTRLPELA
jgi:hypothetical protein